MKCRAILRTHAHAGQQCPSEAQRNGWCRVHDPRTVLPKLKAKRERMIDRLLMVERAIEAYENPAPVFEGNPS